MDHTDLLAKGPLFAYLTVFVGGFLTSLTPCVYPMISITVSLFGARGDNVTRKRAMALAATYVGGIGAMYTALGVSFALAGKAFGTFMASPWVMVPIAVLFIAMAASMFGAFELALPTGLQTRLSSVGGKGFGGAFIMGLVGGIIAAPCTGPVLASILTYVATTRSIFFGGSLLLVYAMGMGVLFFVIAAFAVSLPKSGRWMEAVKSVFGVVMIVAALYFLRNAWKGLQAYASWKTWFLAAHSAAVVAGLAIGAIHLSFHDGFVVRLRKGVGIAGVVVGAFGVIAWMLTPKPLEWVKGEAAGVAAAKAAQKPAFLDFYADWCLPCKELELSTFDSPKVREAFNRFTLVKVDMTSDDDPIVDEMRKKYGADTLPTLVLLSSNGQVAKKIDHVVGPDELLGYLKQVQ